MMAESGTFDNENPDLDYHLDHDDDDDIDDEQAKVVCDVVRLDVINQVSFYRFAAFI